MMRLIGLRILTLIPILFIVTGVTFLLLEVGPGDPAAKVLGNSGSPDDYARIRAEMGLDQPTLQRYLDWLGGVLRGDLGRNLVPPIENVSDRVMRAFPINVELALLALAMALLIAVPLAVASAARPNGIADRIISGITIGTISVPPFLSGVILLLVFAIMIPLFPLGQWARPSDAGWVANLHHAFLPALTLALAEAPVFVRLLRADLLTALREDFVVAARAKGMSPGHVLWREALRPASFSLLTLAGVSAGRLLGGTIIVEVIYSLPGLGSVIISAAQANDYTLVQGGVLLIAAVYLMINLVVEILYGYLDPRIRRARV